MSVAGDHAIFSGVVSGPFSFLDDFSSSKKPSAHGNLFRRVTQKKKRAVIFSSDCLRGTYGSDTDLSISDKGQELFNQRIISIIVFTNTMIMRDYLRNSGKKCAYSSDCFSRIDMEVNYGKFAVFKTFV